MLRFKSTAEMAQYLYDNCKPFAALDCVLGETQEEQDRRVNAAVLDDLVKRTKLAMESMSEDGQRTFERILKTATTRANRADGQAAARVLRRRLVKLDLFFSSEMPF